MSRWAVVIGIDEYVMPGASLQGAVRDALRMCCWLLDPVGGNVPRHQLFLALHPTAPLPDVEEPCRSVVPSLRPLACPNKDAMVDLFDLVVNKSGGDGERLYVYFAGHGLQYEVTPTRFLPAIVAPDCDALHPDRSLTIPSILEYFEATGFLDQFFFVDACRNVPWSGRFEAGRVSRGPSCPPPATAPQQFACLATTAGSFAAELQSAGEEGGAFTNALLRGLSGQESAKAFDPETDRFVVRWNRLFEFVRSDVQRIKRTLTNGEKLVQVPRDELSKRGANRSSDPLLWSIDAASARFDDVNLLVQIEPGPAAPTCHLTLRDLYDEEASPRTLPPSPEVPKRIPLPPRWYRVIPQSPGYRYPKAKGLSVELMAPRDISLEMERDAGPTLSRGLTPPSSPPPRPAGAAGTTAAEEDTVLIVDPEDPLVPWDLVDASGNTTAHAGARRLVLKPGLYTVRTTTPEGAVSEALLDLERGESERVAVRLPAPSRAMEQLAGRTGFGMLRDDSQRVELSEALGPVANVTLSTTLALAARVATFGLDPGFGRKLRAMNLAPSTPVLAGGTGIMVVFAAEQSADAEHAYTAVEELEGVRIAWWNTGTQPPAERQQIDIRGDFPAIGQWMTPSPPGHGWLAIAAPGQPAALFHLFVPRFCVLVVVVHRQMNGEVGVYVHASAPGDASSTALRHTRLLDLVERYMLRGRYDYPRSPDDLLAERPSDPIANVVAAYLWLRRGEQDRALSLASYLAERNPDWSDPYLIRGEALIRTDEATAREAYSRALTTGLPIFAGGLARLWQSIDRLHIDIDDTRRATLEHVIANRLHGVLWTAATSLPKRG